jgi:tyrosyl-tRNA synthetase
VAQAALAADLTARIHGPAEAKRQEGMADAAFAASVTDPEVLTSLYDAIGGFEFGSEADAWTAIDVAVAAAGSSRGEARRLITQGGFSINGEKLTDPAATPPALIDGRFWWVAMGRRRRLVGRRAS